MRFLFQLEWRNKLSGPSIDYKPQKCRPRAMIKVNMNILGVQSIRHRKKQKQIKRMLHSNASWSPPDIEKTSQREANIRVRREIPFTSSLNIYPESNFQVEYCLHICGRFTFQTNFVSPKVRGFAICRPPAILLLCKMHVPVFPDPWRLNCMHGRQITQLWQMSNLLLLRLWCQPQSTNISRVQSCV